VLLDQTIGHQAFTNASSIGHVYEQESGKPSIFANRDYKLLFGGSTLSALGDQFTLVALPWLVLKLTGDAAAPAPPEDFCLSTPLQFVINGDILRHKALIRQF